MHRGLESRSHLVGVLPGEGSTLSQGRGPGLWSAPCSLARLAGWSRRAQQGKLQGSPGPPPHSLSHPPPPKGVSGRRSLRKHPPPRQGPAGSPSSFTHFWTLAAPEREEAGAPRPAEASHPSPRGGVAPISSRWHQLSPSHKPSTGTEAKKGTAFFRFFFFCNMHLPEQSRTDPVLLQLKLKP